MCHTELDELITDPAPTARKVLSLVGFVAILASAARQVLFTFGGECCTTEMSRNPAPLLSESDEHRG